MKPIAIVVPLVVLSVAAARAQTSCDDPDNLCTGDPCIIDAVSVAAPCVADFGSRTLVVRGRLDVGSGSPPTVNFSAGAIVVERGADIVAIATLTASGPIDFDGRLGWPDGSIRLQAGGFLTVAGTIDGSSQCNVADCEGGTLRLRGGAGVIVDGRIVSRGFVGGLIDINSASGDVIVNRTLNVAGRSAGGDFIVRAAGDVVLNGDLITGPGGTIEVTGDNVTINRSLRGKGIDIDILVQAAGDLLFFGRAKAKGSGTVMRLLAGGLTHVGASAILDARGAGATIQVEGANVDVQGNVRTNGRPDRVYGRPGAEVRFAAIGGDLTLSGSTNVKGKTNGGIIVGSATNDLTATGRFACRAPLDNGCIRLSAGGTLDIAAATFDKAPDAACSPSGAFLD